MCFPPFSCDCERKAESDVVTIFLSLSLLFSFFFFLFLSKPLRAWNDGKKIFKRVFKYLP